MVNDGTIDRAVSAILAFEAAGPMADTAGNPDVIGGELIRLNMEALRQRYNEKPLAFTYKHREHDDKDPALARYKAVGCLTYQCAEGNVPDMPLYQQLIAVENDLAQQCARRMRIKPDRVALTSAYNSLPWDFDD
jgi:hypothetical protein